jgi:rhodanese-related sulfurtransferase
MSKLLIKYLLNTSLYCFFCYSQASFASDKADFTKSVSVVQAQEIISHKRDDNQFEIIDVRTLTEYQTGHLTGSKQLDFYAEKFDQHLAKLDKNKTYMLYCRTGVRSIKTLSKMKALGFTKVYNMQGGLIAWQAKQ